MTERMDLKPLGLPEDVLSRKALPFFSQLFSLLIENAPAHPQYHLIENCFKALTILNPLIMEEFSLWADPLYGHNLCCYVRLLYPSNLLSSTPITSPITSITSPTSAPACQSQSTSSLTHSPLLQSELVIPTQPYDLQSPPYTTMCPREILLTIFSKYGSSVAHPQCEHITVLHSILSVIQFSSQVSKALSSTIFLNISEKFLNHYDALDDVNPLMIALDNPFTLYPFELLLKTKKCNVNSPSKSGKRVLQHLIQKGERRFATPTTVSTTTPNNASLPTPSFFSTSSSIVSASSTSSTNCSTPADLLLHACQLLIDYGAQLYYPKENPQTQPLSLAINTRCDRIGVFLVQHGYPVNSQFTHAQPILHAAISQHMTQTALALIDSGADIIGKSQQDGNTILHIAAMYNNVDIIQLLINRGYDVEVQNLQGQTALECLIQHSHAHHGVIQFLLHNGANPNHVSKRNVPLLCQALFRHNYDQIRALLSFTYAEKVKAEEALRKHFDHNSNYVTAPPLKTTSVTHATKSTSNIIYNIDSPKEKKGWFRSIFSSQSTPTTASPKTSIKNPPKSPTVDKTNPLTGKMHPLTLPNVNQTCPKQIYYGSTFLYACQNAPQDIVEIMIRYHNANLLQKNENGMTALHIAVQRSQEVLYQQQVNIEKQQQWLEQKLGGPMTPLEYQIILNQQRQNYTNTNTSTDKFRTSGGSSQLSIDLPKLQFQHTLSGNSHHEEITFRSSNSVSSGNSSPINFVDQQKQQLSLPPPHHHHSTTSTTDLTLATSPTSNPHLQSTLHDSTTMLTTSTIQNRKTLANSFHLSSVVYDPLEVLSTTLEVTAESVLAIPNYDPASSSFLQHHHLNEASSSNRNKNTNPLFGSFHSANNAANQITTPSTTTTSPHSNQLHPSAIQTRTSFHSQFLPSLHQQPLSPSLSATVREPHRLPHTPAASPLMMLNLGGIHTVSTSSLPQPETPTKTTPLPLQTTSPTFCHTTINRTTRATSSNRIGGNGIIVPHLSKQTSSSASIQNITPSDDINDDQSLRSIILDNDNVSTISSIHSPLSNSFKHEPHFASSPLLSQFSDHNPYYSSYPQHHNIDAAKTSLLSLETLHDEDEDVIFLGRFLVTLRSFFFEQDSDFEFV